MEEPELLTVAEVAALLRTTRAAVYERVRRNPHALPGRVKIGRRMFFRREILQAWIARGGG
ncbi:MAG: helix-turn-helix domain-containing protein [Myxococcales bacterium]|nr:helix-turn-helix domain-containing protein [Myxococcales bacterium]